jgi:hypothetical protein
MSIDARAVAKKALFGFTSAALLALPNSALARVRPALGVQVVPALPILVAAGSSCIFFTYDANGNRTAQVITVVSSGQATWGTAKFGCSLWSAP